MVPASQKSLERGTEPAIGGSHKEVAGDFSKT